MHYIYTITNTSNGRQYVGNTRAERVRLNNTIVFGMQPLRYCEHLLSLRRGDHFNSELQADWDVCQWTDFRFDVIDATEDGLQAAKDLERHWIKQIENTYNILGARKYRKSYNVIPPFIVREVKSRLAAQELGKDIAQDLGISSATVSLIKNGIAHAHIN